MSELQVPDKNLGHLWLDVAERFPRRAALWSERGSLNYQQFLHEVRCFAGLLQHWGVSPGDRVFLLLPNWPQFVIACQAVFWVGGVAALSSPMTPPTIWVEQLRRARPRVVVTSNRLDPALARSLRELGVERILLTSGREYLRTRVGWMLSQPRKSGPFPSGVVRWRQVMREALPVRLPWYGGGEHPAALLFSGGTSGSPKGVELSHRALWANVLQLLDWDPQMQPGRERLLAALPLAHAYGLTGVMNLGLASGSTMILSSSLDPAQLAQWASRLRPSLFPGTPALYASLLNLPDLRGYRFDSIRLCASGSAPLPREVQEGFERVTRARVMEGYGLTEAGPVTHASPLGENRAVPGSVGLPLRATEAQILDLESGLPLSAGGVGELVVRGPQLMTGYWDEPQASAAALQNGWLHTGDLGMIDSSGFAYLLGRLDDCCRIGGQLVYPRRIEEVIHLHPAVQEVAVLGWPGGYRQGAERIGEAEGLHAFVVPRPGQRVSVDDLRGYLQVRLPEVLRPSLWTVLPQLPRTPFGKVSRISLYGAL